MLCKDNREFITRLKKTGDVVRIKQPVSWGLEVGAITNTKALNNVASALNREL